MAADIAFASELTLRDLGTPVLKAFLRALARVNAGLGELSDQSLDDLISSLDDVREGTDDLTGNLDHGFLIKIGLYFSTGYA